jgi:GTP-binding protein
MFIDQASIHVKSGKGGDGVVHFRREKFVPRGGPDGGDGGKGGDVIFEVKPTLNTLLSLQYSKELHAQDGANGAKSNQTGHSGEPLIIPVPPGTIVYDAADGKILGDLVDEGQQLVICKGGRGGRGNARFANSRNQAPRVAEKGEPAEEKHLRLELKLIADIGIVGVPNAGKSTFLTKVTQAKPKVAPYPFTTLTPNLGVAVLDDENTLVLADIPGLIEGAHKGIGLGHDFLRHVQRTRVLIHLLDGMAEDPVLDFAQINSELALFDPALAQKPQVVALNKIDLPEVQERWPKIRSALKKRGYASQAISALNGENVRAVLYEAAQKLAEAPTIFQVKIDADEEIPLYRMKESGHAFTITRDEEGWHLAGKAIERAAAMTYWEYDQSVRRFQRILETLGVDHALRAKGVQAGDTVFIGDYELEWQD